MSNLSNLIDKRQKSYSKFNDKILKLLADNVIPAILEMMDLSDQEIDKLEWRTVQVVEDYLILTGSIKYDEGDIISDDDTVVTLDAALALVLDKVIRAAVPFSLACTGSKNEVILHLKAAEKKLREEYEAVYGHEPETLEDVMFEAIRGQLGIDFGQEFDYTDLTEEQKEAYSMWGMTANPKGEKPN